MEVRFSSMAICLAKLCIIALSLTSISACGVYSFSGASIPPEAKTISIANFPDMAGATPPGLSNTFTEGLKDIFTKQTRLSLVRSDGDFAFEGQITSYTHAPTAITSNDIAAMERLTMSVRVTFKNRFVEAENFDKTFSQYAEYSTTSSTFEREQPRMVQEIVEKLAEDIFNASAANW